jgi:hypothetical protein
MGAIANRQVKAPKIKLSILDPILAENIFTSWLRSHEMPRYISFMKKNMQVKYGSWKVKLELAHTMLTKADG